MHIQAAVTREKGGKFNIESLNLEAPRPDELLVRVVAVGVCHTDIVVRDQIYPVPQPVVLGHEGSGIVEQIGSNVTGFSVGDKVVMSYTSCGSCLSCINHAPTYCQLFFPLNFSGSRLDGSTSLSCDSGPVHSHFFGQSSFATHVVVPKGNVVKVNADIPLDVLAPFGCGIQTGAGAVINSLKVQAGDTLAVFGTGAVGLSAVMAANLLGVSRIIAVDRNVSRLHLATELGATHIINTSEANPVDVIKQITAIGVSHAIDTTALMPVIGQAFAALAPRGILGVIGACKPDDLLPIPVMDLLTSGKHIRGIVEGDSEPAVFLPKLFDFYAQGKFPVDKIVSFYEFSEINKAVHDSETGKSIKAVLRL